MADNSNDVVIAAAERLKELPAPDAAAVERIVAAAARARQLDLAPDADDLMPPSPRRLGAWSVAGIAVAAAVAGFLLRPAAVPLERTPPVAAVIDAPALSVVASNAARELAPIATQFVLDAPDARSVTLVADFNEWGEKPIELERVPGSSLWSATVPVVPGRHVYAFMVNGSTWTPDPRAPRAPDEDFGVAGSVIVVGRP